MEKIIGVFLCDTAATFGSEQERIFNDESHADLTAATCVCVKVIYHQELVYDTRVIQRTAEQG